ncbi:hypothetical protein EPIB1_946 [Tritonibacter mobilis]|nr:hypothetical protein EPIB1_946 [Tritonibacter mobilis]
MEDFPILRALLSTNLANEEGQSQAASLEMETGSGHWYIRSE